MDEKTKNGTGGNNGNAGEGGDHDDVDIDARINAILDAKLNPAITTHMKRQSERFQTMLDAAVAKLTAPKSAEGNGGNGGNNAGGDNTGNAGQQGSTQQQPRTDPEVLKLREDLAKLQKQAADAEAARAAAEKKAARDATHTALRERLADHGVTGVRARAVIADMEASGALRMNEETGAYELAVKRVRTRGGTRAEEAVYDDLAAGVKDWTQTEEAAEFIPAQTGTQQRQTSTRPGAQGAQRGPLGTTTTNAQSARGRQPADPLAGLNDADVFGD